MTRPQEERVLRSAARGVTAECQERGAKRRSALKRAGEARTRPDSERASARERRPALRAESTTFTVLVLALRKLHLSGSIY